MGPEGGFRFKHKWTFYEESWAVDPVKVTFSGCDVRAVTFSGLGANCSRCAQQHRAVVHTISFIWEFKHFASIVAVHSISCLMITSSAG